MRDISYQCFNFKKTSIFFYLFFTMVSLIYGKHIILLRHQVFLLHLYCWLLQVDVEVSCMISLQYAKIV